MHNTLTIWRFTDNKRGHENQTSGLVNALQEMTPVDMIDLPQNETSGNLLNWMCGTFPSGRSLAHPDLLIGAGRRTHLPLLAAKRSRRAPAVVLMLPAPWLRPYFDLCLVPEHDRAKASNILPTCGTLNAIIPGKGHPQRGIILIGGPSRHHRWDGPAMVGNVQKVIARTPAVDWKVTTSRRTPSETVQALVRLAHANLQVVPAERTSINWVPQELAASAFSWVSEDSVSMVYESLTSGAATGILPVPRRHRNSRVTRGLDSLVIHGQVARLDPASPVLRTLDYARPPLAESSRCARIVLERFFPHFLSHQS